MRHWLTRPYVRKLHWVIILTRPAIFQSQWREDHISPLYALLRAGGVCISDRKEDKMKRTVITVVGKDTVGIIAKSLHVSGRE